MTDLEIDNLLQKYKHHFKHLRALPYLKSLHGDVFLEAETPDGRYISGQRNRTVESITQQLEDWSPKEQV